VLYFFLFALFSDVESRTIGFLLFGIRGLGIAAAHKGKYSVTQIYIKKYIRIKQIRIIQDATDLQSFFQPLIPLHLVYTLVIIIS
jgi:hypothetical protein